MSTPSRSINAARQQAFAGKVVGDMSSTLTTLLSVIGDRLGLFKALDEHGPLTARELASRLQLNERYIREWLGGMAANGYLSYDTQSQRFTSTGARCVPRRGSGTDVRRRDVSDAARA